MPAPKGNKFAEVKPLKRKDKPVVWRVTAAEHAWLKNKAQKNPDENKRTVAAFLREKTGLPKDL
jgi:hypothetical protein